MWKLIDFCDSEVGFDYVFTKMSAIYGSAFANMWRDVEPEIIREAWIFACGRGLTYRPKMDYALAHLNPDRPPSALAFAKLLNEAPRIPDKPETLITRQVTAEEKIYSEQAKAEAKSELKKLIEKMRVK